MVVPRKKSRAEAKQHTRDRLIAAATKLFSARGIDAPSLDEICDHAGFTRGAFYVHFPDRDALITAVMERAGRTFLDALLTPDEDLSSIATRFVTALASGAYPLTRKGGIRPYQLLDACARSPAIRKQYVSLVRETITRLAAATRRSQTSRHIRADIDADAISFLLITSVIGLHTLLDLDVEVDVPQSAATVLSLLAR